MFTAAALGESELNQKYMTLKDNHGQVITRTAHEVVVGDEYLNSKNQLFRVYRVSGNLAKVKMVKSDALKVSAWTEVIGFLSSLFRGDFFRSEVKQRGPIAIYHTHSDESYVEGDGVSSKRGNGGIFQVGDTLTRSFEKLGVPVVHSKVPHDPHDALAYDRSRRTAAQLLKQQPTVLLDVHRDAVPRQEYAAVVNKENVTQVQLVVGRQNPNFQASNDFAKQIKASVDKKAPGLIKGIFYGRGKYNQDLGPRTMLLEIGSHTNSKAAAERGASLFAAAAKDVLYGNVGAGVVNRGGMRNTFWIVVAALGGIGLFLLLNHSGLKSIRREFAGALGEKSEEKRKNDPSDPDHNGESS
ncbi:stage II sporulation protein P [Hydrogenispora ethanolica]|nr:stage II sporulation protein P [Hydrogenispora ethanolica]